jgi:hypothetical protein
MCVFVCMCSVVWYKRSSSINGYGFDNDNEVAITDVFWWRDKCLSGCRSYTRLLDRVLVSFSHFAKQIGLISMQSGTSEICILDTSSFHSMLIRVNYVTSTKKCI